MHTVGKRQGDVLQDPSQKRRAAFGDITNVSNMETFGSGKQKGVASCPVGSVVKGSALTPMQPGLSPKFWNMGFEDMKSPGLIIGFSACTPVSPPQ